MAEFEDIHWWCSARRSILNRAILKIDLPKRARILEAGCGTGGNLPMLARHGQVFGMESDAGALAFANSRNCAQVLAGSLPDDIPFPNDSFDLVVMADVLEHLDDEVASLRALRLKLTARG